MGIHLAEDSWSDYFDDIVWKSKNLIFFECYSSKKHSDAEFSA